MQFTFVARCICGSLVFTQTGFAWRVAGGFSRAPVVAAPGDFPLRTHSFLLLYAVVGACHLRHSRTKWSVAPLSTLNTYEF